MKFLSLPWCAIAMLSVGSQAAPAQGPSAFDKAAAEGYIRDSERRWAASVATGDATIVTRILADDFIGVNPDGKIYDKATMVGDTKQGPTYFGSNQLNDLKLRLLRQHGGCPGQRVVGEEIRQDRSFCVDG